MTSKFDITQHIQFSNKGRASCPVCESIKGKVNPNLSLVPGTDGAYKCFRGCTPDDIRSALGVGRDRQVPAALVKSSAPAGKVTVSPQKVMEAHKALMESSGPAKAWLHDRGITDGMIQRYRLGIVRAKCGDRMLPAISIPIPNHDGTAYYQKKRVAPWLKPSELAELPDYKPWSQAGIPAQTYFTWLPAEATETILCEGEWDAMLLGQMMREKDKPIAVASFTAGCGNLPKDPRQFDLLPGTVYVCYDLDAPGEKGASKVAAVLGSRARLMTCPMSSVIKADDPAADTTGWDISDAINSGSSIGDFQEAMKQATAIAVIADIDVTPEKTKPTSLRSRLVSNAEMMATAPDYVEMLVPDLLPANEMIMLAAGARAGKSLLAMLLAKCVATGENFLDRPVIQGAVLYISCEDSPVKLKQREIAQGWEADIPVYWIDRFKMSQLAELRELAIELDVRLIILDTLSRIRDDGVTESSSEMSRVMEPYQELAGELGCCILLVHHTNKVSVENAGSIDIFDTIRGSSAIRATCRGSIVLAADNDCYRLCAENGYGKTDLKVRLDGNTLEWRLIGRWTDQVSSDLKSTVMDYLAKVGEATLEQVFEETQISKNSLYKTLSRLAGDGMIAKSGHRRNVVYKRSIGLIGQSDTLSDSRNADTATDRGSIGQKTISSTVADKVISDQSGICATLITSPIDDHFEAVPDRPTYVSDNSQKADTASISAIGQLSDKGHLSDEADQSDDSDPYIQPAKPSNPFNCTLEPGDVCSVLQGKLKGQEVTMVRYAAGYPGMTWITGQHLKSEVTIQRSHLGLLRRAGDANG